MMTKIIALATVSILLTQYFRQRNKNDLSQKMANRLCEFFNEPDLTMAIDDYYHILVKHGSPEHAFATVLHKGGFDND